MSLIDKSLSGLNASRAALSATSNNVANALVEGYSRQQVMTSSLSGGFYGEGNGVDVDGIRRISDRYQVAQLWSSSSAVSYSQTQATYLGQVEQIFSGEGNNIATGLDELFSALNSALLQPNESAYRQSVLNEAQSLSQRFNSISQGLEVQMAQIESQISASTTEINSQLQSLAKLNIEIQASTNSGEVSAALLDARDQQINELAQVINIDVVAGSNNMLNLSLSNGQPLLVGGQAAKFEVSPSLTDPSISDVNVNFANTKFPVTELSGGSLGGILDYREDTLIPGLDFINEFAQQFADEMNTILAGGTDLSGATPSQNLFSYDVNNPAGSLQLSDGFTTDMLAFGQDGTPGDNSNLQQLIAVSSHSFSFSSLSTSTTLSDAFSGQIGRLGSQSRQATVQLNTDVQLQQEAQNQWASTSGVNVDEEGANLIIYQQAYQANARVLSVADELFQTILNNT